MSSHVPATLEPSSLAECLRPDGVSQVPWTKGKFLAWDFTCVDTLAPTYRSIATNDVGSIASDAEQQKMTQYSSLAANFLFIPIACETLGGWGPEATRFITALGKRLRSETCEPRAAEFLRQRLSMAVQRGNATSIFDSINAGEQQ